MSEVIIHPETSEIVVIEVLGGSSPSNASPSGTVFIDRIIDTDIDVPDNTTFLTHDPTIALGVTINLGTNSTMLVL